MATVLVNDGHVGWLAHRDKLVDALDHLGWKQTFYNGHEARLEPDHYSPLKPPYAVLCERVDAILTALASLLACAVCFKMKRPAVKQVCSGRRHKRE